MIAMPRVRFAALPTPIEALPRLRAKIGGPILQVKRDDLTGLGLGGNKTRKLEYVLAAAQANGAKTLISVGAAQSNHCRQTAALAARYGLGCILVLSGQADQPQTGNYLADTLFGAEIVWCSRAERESVLQQTFQAAWDAGRRPYLIPLGASTPIGTLGYVNAFEEVVQQGDLPDWMVVASSSGGTQAGLALGARIFAPKVKVLGISIDNAEHALQTVVANLANEAADRLRTPERLTAEDIRVNADYLGGGYGVVGEPELEAIRLFAELEGLLLDPVYTGRAAAGLLDLIRKGYFKPEEKVLFWHTGGTPAIFAQGYQELLAR
jgi:D-cysteine desulfhydrase family pyridoxal phosphate-dependent enzyme